VDDDLQLMSASGDLRAALADFGAPAYLLDRDGRIRWTNKAARELVGDWRGMTFAQAVAPEQRALVRDNFAQKVAGSRATAYDVWALRKDGSRVLVRAASAPLWDGDAVVGVFGIAVPLDEEAPCPAAGDGSEPTLTPRQLEVLRLLGEGLETPDIARRLGIAEETTRNHIRALLRAMGVHSRLEAVVVGQRLGLISSD
jgi:PAS domain S-box-containing protein